MMLLELSKLAVGLVLLIFHRPFAEFAIAHDRAVMVLFAQRRLRLPQLSTATAYNIYFGAAVFICAVELVRIWMMLP
jgi:hypothetical protein